MRLIKFTLMACAGAALVAGCSTTYYEDRDAQGRPLGEPEVYHGSSVPAWYHGVNTNYFGPVNSGPEAARGPGTPSGGF